MEISTKEIRLAFESLLAEFENTGLKDWNISKEFYWDITTDERYDSYNSPKELGMGQLSEDIERIKRIASGEDSSILANLFSAFLRSVISKAHSIIWTTFPSLSKIGNAWISIFLSLPLSSR